MKQFFESVWKDHQSGSSRILEQVIWGFNESIHHDSFSKESSSRLCLELEEIAEHHKDLIVIQHFSNQAKSKLIRGLQESDYQKSIESWLDDYKKEWRDVNKRIAKNFLELNPLKKSTLLFHSHSGALVELGKQLSMSGFDGKIIQTISEPGSEGKIQAIELDNLELEVELIEDETAIYRMKAVDQLVFGADQFNSQEWLNKIGTRSLTECANSFDVPVWILADSRKKVNAVSVNGEIFEKTPLSLATGLITENVKI